MKHIRPYLGLVFFFVLYLWNFPIVWKSPEQLGRFDWDLYTFHVEFLRKSYLEFNTFPLWNPYYGAGFPVWENPSSKLGSFTHLFALFLPSVDALKLSFLFYFALAGILNYQSFRLYNQSKQLTPILFVCLFQFSGFFFQKFYAGHLNQIQGLFLPAFVFYFLTYLKENRNWILIPILLVAYILLSEGAIYTITQIAFLVIFLAGREVFLSDRKKETIYHFFSLSLILLVVLSFKWIPMFLLVHKVGRHFVPDQFPLNLSDLYSIFFGSSQHPLLSQALSQMQYRYWEYGNYLGQIPFYLSPLLLFTKRKMDSVLGLLGLVVWIMIGKTSSLSPVTILENLPIYSLERVYPRWSLSVVFLFVWCLVMGIQTITDKTPKKYERHLSISLLILLFLHTLDVRKMNTKYLDEIFVLLPPTLNISNQESYPITVGTVPDYGSDSRMLPALQANLSINDIYENLTFSFANQTIDSPEYHGEFFLYPSYKKIKPVHWKPDTFHLEKLPAGQILMINQKFHPGFITNVPELKTCSLNGYLAIMVTKSIHQIQISYSPFASFSFYGKNEFVCETLKKPSSTEKNIL